MDLLGNFISDCCITGPDQSVQSKELYLAYSKWCEENVEYQLKQASFGRKLQEKGFDSKQIGKGRTRYRTGINLMDQVLID